MNNDKQPAFLISTVAGLLEGVLAFLIGEPLMFLRINSVDRLQFLVLCVASGIVLGVCVGILIDYNSRIVRSGRLIEVIVGLVAIQILAICFVTQLLESTWLT